MQCDWGRALPKLEGIIRNSPFNENDVKRNKMFIEKESNPLVNTKATFALPLHSRRNVLIHLHLLLTTSRCVASVPHETSRPHDMGNQ